MKRAARSHALCSRLCMALWLFGCASQPASKPESLDETLAEKGSEADERLEVYYACLGLGFQGWYAGQPEFLRKKMSEIAPRIGRVHGATTELHRAE